MDEKAPICAREGCGNPVSHVKHGRRKKYCGPPCRQAAWQERNYEHNQALKKKWQDNNRDHLRAKSLAYYYATKEAFLAKQKVKYQRTRLTSPWKHIFNAAKARAAARKLPFDLTHDWIKARWTGHCELTGLPFVVGSRLGTSLAFSASIDRKEPRLGYTQTNCRLVLRAVNSFKGDDTDEIMLRIARALLAFMDK